MPACCKKALSSKRLFPLTKLHGSPTVRYIWPAMEPRERIEVEVVRPLRLCSFLPTLACGVSIRIPLWSRPNPFRVRTVARWSNWLRRPTCDSASSQLFGSLRCSSTRACTQLLPTRLAATVRFRCFALDLCDRCSVISSSELMQEGIKICRQLSL
jgi:hypothetical protein